MLSAANGSFVIIFFSLLFNCSFAISVFKILSITYLVKSLVYPTPPLVSIDDSLFNMGLDSLMAIKFSVAAHKVFGIYIDIKDLYKYDSIRALADFVDNQVHSNKNYLPEIQKTDAQDFYPLSSGQKRIYYACKMAGNDNIVYNTPGAILVDSILNKETVESAFKDIIKRQSIFRTVFVIENEEVKQKVLDNVDFAV